MSIYEYKPQVCAGGVSGQVSLPGRRFPYLPKYWRPLACVLSLIALGAYGHGHNLSTGTLKIFSDHAEAHLIFARNEIQAILPFDQNGDGVVSPEERANEQQYLDALGPNLAEMAANDQPAKLESVRAVIDANNDVYFDLVFRYAPATRFAFHPGIVKRMPGVHRLFVSVIDPEGNSLGQHFISPWAETLLLEKGAVSVPRTADPAAVATASATDPHDDRQGDGLPVAAVVQALPPSNPLTTVPPAQPVAPSHVRLWLLSALIAVAGLLAWRTCRIARTNV